MTHRPWKNSTSSSWALFNAVGWALFFHLLLFYAIRPSHELNTPEKLMPKIPNTHYLSSSKTDGLQTADARTIWSPVLFTLPSKLGFSQALLQQKIEFNLTIESHPLDENFLEKIDLIKSNAPILPNANLKSTTKQQRPNPPSSNAYPPVEKSTAPRTYMAPQLANRLSRPIELPESLNIAEKSTWEAHAQLYISEQGEINEVFLDKPLADKALNKEVLCLLYSMRFKPGNALSGTVEIYSVPAQNTTEENP